MLVEIRIVEHQKWLLAGIGINKDKKLVH